MVDNTSLNVNWADYVNLDNLVPYTHSSAAWSDRHSNIAVWWSNPGASGLQNFRAVVGWAGTEITSKLLAWDITEDQKPLMLKFISRNYRPDKVSEVDSGEGLRLTVTAAYPVRNAIAVEFELINYLTRNRVLKISFTYPSKGISPDWKGPFPAGYFVSLEGEPEGSWSTLFVHHEHGRQTKWVENFVAGMTEGATFEMCCVADLSNRTVRLCAKGKVRFVIAMGFGRYHRLAWEAYHEAKENIDAGWTAMVETERWGRLFKGSPSLPPKYRGKEKYERMYAHALAGLNSLFIQGKGGYTGFKRIPYTTKAGLAIAFFWDTAFSCIGARDLNPLMCQEAIEAFADNVGPRGSMPGTLCDTHRAGEGQAPIMAWAAWLVYQKSGDKSWLARIYPTLCSNNKFWFKYHASPRGLCAYFNAGQIGDNDARFDPVYGRPQGNEPVYGFEAPDLNAFLVVQMKCLSFMANELSRKKEADQWRSKAAKLGKLVIDFCYFSEESMFYDVKEGTHEKFSGVKNPNMFLPLWAGVPLPEKEIRNIVEKHMLNPAEFFRDLPFPSLSYDDPKYEPSGYWRGRIWPHVGYWMIQILWKYGYHDEAEVMAKRLLRLFEGSSWFHENYESSKGRGIGFPEYNWSHATVIELLLERYKEPIIGAED